MLRRLILVIPVQLIVSKVFGVGAVWWACQKLDFSMMKELGSMRYLLLILTVDF